MNTLFARPASCLSLYRFRSFRDVTLNSKIYNREFRVSISQSNQSSLRRFYSSSFNNNQADNFKAPGGEVNDIFIAGAGCIGQGLAVSLLKSNPLNRVFLITKPQYIRDIHKLGITTKGVVEGTFFPNRNFVIIDKVDDSLFDEYNIARNPIVFSSTKAADTVASLLPFQKVSKINDLAIICLQNGIGTEQEVQGSLPRQFGTVLKGHVLGAVHKKGADLFAYKGKILVDGRNGNVSKTLQDMFLDQKNGIFDLELSQNIYRDIYPKVAVNCVCNPLTIIFNRNLGFIKNNFEPLIKLICDEVYTAARSQGIPIESSQHLTEFVLNMMSKFSEHRSSMYLDHVAGKETEIDYINGGVLRIARENRIDLPINQLLAESIKEIEGMRAKTKSAEEFYQMHDSYLEGLTKRLLNFSNNKA